jgi:hypothetical protein
VVVGYRRCRSVANTAVRACRLAGMSRRSDRRPDTWLTRRSRATPNKSWGTPHITSGSF